MKITINVREYPNAPAREMDIRCFFGIHAYTPWTYRDGKPPMHKSCRRCGEWVWHTASWDAANQDQSSETKKSITPRATTGGEG